MNRLSIRTRGGTFRAELDDSDVSNAIWLDAPLELTTNMLEGMAYCNHPISAILPKEGRDTVFEVGDIAYWPGPGAICFFFGPTILSGEDGRPSFYYPLIKIGRMIGDCSGFSMAGDGQRIVLEQDFRSVGGLWGEGDVPGGPGTLFSSRRAQPRRTTWWGRSRPLSE